MTDILAIAGANLLSPVILCFVLGLGAALARSDLSVPEAAAKAMSIYLLFAIGFKGGTSVAAPISTVIPLYAFFLLRRRLGASNAGSIAAAYGSVSAVTFVAAAGFLEMQGLAFGGHMVAVMALMECPAIIMGVVLIRRYEKEEPRQGMGGILHHALTNGSVLMLLGSLFIGLVADSRQAEGIRPFTTDIFKGFLAIFLLEMGMVTARRFAAFRRHGWTVLLFAILVPAFNGSAVAWLSGWVTQDAGDRFMFAILAASASYIAVPAAMRLAAPKADPGIYIPMALGVTFPFNITIGFPLYSMIVGL